ncbi:hypothetical protein BerOc1_01032 [Pseudodesulfovibrio hydrargyri]|uniref:Uncharacterized protein n=1 Tax=Pseudodesulfovibrio hydrargyri TaxID=2125990 RepID=A0A1J5MR87_9BACT|nr:hypothetical protein [Pseudodesulfovibrio hydrargyri]OIQ49110.1 hypothetical protein BerOc1_01032 [Pseudodesulfovibrio hydrargyri]
MSESMRNATPSDPAAARAPFSGLGQAMRAVEAVALSYSPRWEEEPAAVRPVRPRPAEAYGYDLQCRLCRETRAG